MRSGLLEIVATRASNLALAGVRGMANAALRISSPSERSNGSLHRWAETTGIRIAFLIPLGVAGLAAVIVELGAMTFQRGPGPRLAAAETVAARFPENWSADPAPEATAQYALASISEPSQQLALFSPFPTYTGSVDTTAAVPPESPAPLAEERPERIPLPVPAPARRSNNGRPNAILNDAQIASVKQRLRLTPDQERMWPAVEAALRSISYSKTVARSASEARVQGKQVASIDPNTPEVQNLKSAAFPLLMSFNSDQKEEVRSLTRLMGLEQLASMF